MLPLKWKTIPLSTIDAPGGAVADIGGVYVIFDAIGVLLVGQAQSIQRDIVKLCQSQTVHEVRKGGGTVHVSLAPVHRLLKSSVERYLFDTLEPAIAQPQPSALPREVRLPYELSYVSRHRLDALTIADVMPSYGFAP